MIDNPLFYAAAVPAVILLGLGKGGFSGIGLLSLPLMALTIPPLQAAAITLPILIVQDVVSVAAFWRHVDRRNFTVLLPSAAAGILFGYLLASFVTDGAVKLMVGGIALATAVKWLWNARGGAVPAATVATTPAGIFWGLLTGFTSMISNAGGPPFQIYVLPQRLPRDVFIGTGAVLFAFINWIKVPAFTALGQFTPQTLATSAALMPLAIASTTAGVWLVRRVSAERFYGIIYTLLMLVGLKLFVDGARALL